MNIIKKIYDRIMLDKDYRQQLESFPILEMEPGHFEKILKTLEDITQEEVQEMNDMLAEAKEHHLNIFNKFGIISEECAIFYDFDAGESTIFTYRKNLDELIGIFPTENPEGIVGQHFDKKMRAAEVSTDNIFKEILQLNCLVSVTFINQINASKDKFIIECTPRTTKSTKSIYSKKKKYRLITSKVFHSIVNPDALGSKKCEHARRGHWRHYTSDKYVNKKGQKAWINAVWIGETECEKDNIHYKVRLDL